MRVKPDLHGKGYSAAQGIAIANLQSKLAAEEKAVEHWKAEAEKFACAYDSEDRRVDDLMSALEQRAERAEAERDALVAMCAGYRRIIKNIRDQATRNKRASDAQDLLLRDLDFIEDMALEILAQPDAAAEELLKGKRRLEWIKTRCKIVHFPRSGDCSYPIEHDLTIQKNQWYALMDAMQEEAKTDG